jgi:hypothetical protein
MFINIHATGSPALMAGALLLQDPGYQVTFS